MFVEPMLYGAHYGGSIHVAPDHDVLGRMQASWHGAGAMVLHAFVTAPFWLAALGVATAWYLWCRRPDLPGRIADRFRTLHTLLARKYYFDELYESVFATLGRAVGGGLWQVGDVRLIDGLAVNGSARGVGWLSGVVRRLQTGAAVPLCVRDDHRAAGAGVAVRGGAAVTAVGVCAADKYRNRDYGRQMEAVS